MANEVRLIDANALLEELKRINIYDPIHILRDAYIAVRKAPTVKVEPVVHGRWVKKTTDYVYYYVCSECGEPVLKSQWGNDFFSDYCPNCGADMR